MSGAVLENVPKERKDVVFIGENIFDRNQQVSSYYSFNTQSIMPAIG